MERNQKIFNVVFNNFKNDSRVLKTAQSLGGVGYDVTVLAIYGEGLPDREEGELFSVTRIKTFENRLMPKKFEKIFHYLIFLLKCVWVAKDAHYIHCNDLQTLPVGVLLKIWRKKVFLVYDAHEYQIETKNLSGQKKAAKKFLEKVLIPFADEVIVVSESIALEYKKIYGIESPKTIMNCPRFELPNKSDIFRNEFNINEEDRIFLYQGGLSKGRGLNLIIDAFEQVKNAVVVFMGYGELQQEIKQAAARKDNVFFFPAVAPEDLLRHTASADFGICFIEDVCLNYRYCLPNKLFEYTMAGLPTVVSNLPEMKKFVLDNGVGIVMEENSINGLVAAINEVMSIEAINMQQSIDVCRKKYCWENQESKLINLYEGGGHVK